MTSLQFQSSKAAGGRRQRGSIGTAAQALAVSYMCWQQQPASAFVVPTSSMGAPSLSRASGLRASGDVVAGAFTPAANSRSPFLKHGAAERRLVQLYSAVRHAPLSVCLCSPWYAGIRSASVSCNDDGTIACRFHCTGVLVLRRILLIVD